MKHLVSLLFACCVLASASFAQLGLSPIVVAPDTVIQGTQDQITVFLSNDTNITLTGQVDIVVAADSSNQVAVTETVVISIAPGDTSGFTIDVDFSAVNGFEPGGNIVLIWPEMPNNGGVDTLMHNVHVLPPLPAADFDSLGCDPGPQAVPPVLHQDFDLTWSIWNRGSDPVTRGFEVAIATYDGPTLTEVKVVGNQNVSALQPNTSSPGFSSDFELNLIQQFGDGGNVIVVWPRMPNNSTDTFITVDSLWITVEVASLGIEGPESPYLDNVKVFPNPSSGLVYVRFLGGNEPIERVTVTDINGRIVEQHGYTPELDFSSYPAGYYFVKVEVDNGESRIFKMVRY